MVCDKYGASICIYVHTWVGLPLRPDKVNLHNSHLFSDGQFIEMVSYLVIILGTIIMAVIWVIHPTDGKMNCANKLII